MARDFLQGGSFAQLTLVSHPSTLTAHDERPARLPDRELDHLPLVDKDDLFPCYLDYLAESGSLDQRTKAFVQGFFCPISLMCVRQPVFAQDGYVYERSYFEAHVQASSPDHPRSPMTNQFMISRYRAYFSPSPWVRGQIQNWVEARLGKDGEKAREQIKSELLAANHHSPTLTATLRIVEQRTAPYAEAAAESRDHNSTDLGTVMQPLEDADDDDQVPLSEPVERDGNDEISGVGDGQGHQELGPSVYPGQPGAEPITAPIGIIRDFVRAAIQDADLYRRPERYDPEPPDAPRGPPRAVTRFSGGGAVVGGVALSRRALFTL
jgi:hypothetical protein